MGAGEDAGAGAGARIGAGLGVGWVVARGLLAMSPLGTTLGSAGVGNSADDGAWANAGAGVGAGVCTTGVWSHLLFLLSSSPSAGFPLFPLSLSWLPWTGGPLQGRRQGADPIGFSLLQSSLIFPNWS